MVTAQRRQLVRHTAGIAAFVLLLTVIAALQASGAALVAFLGASFTRRWSRSERTSRSLPCAP